MLKKFTVTNFRGFEKMELDLTKVCDYDFNTECVDEKNGIVKKAMIYGRNGTGKTNLGLALADICNFANFGCTDNEFAFNGNLEIDYAKFRYEFYINGTDVVIRYKRASKRKLVDESLEIAGDLIYTYKHGAETALMGDLSKINAQTLNLERKHPEVSLFQYIAHNAPKDDTGVLHKTLDFINHMDGMTPSFDGGEKMLNFVLDTFIENKKVDKFEVFLNECGIDCKLLVERNTSGRKVLYIKYKANPIPFIEAASSGTKVLAVFFHRYYPFTAWNKEASCFFYLDEFDAFYHFELAETIVKLVKAMPNCQAIFTTHNTNLLDNDLLRPDCYFVMDGEKVESLPYLTDRELRYDNSLVRLYKGGAFGG